MNDRVSAGSVLRLRPIVAAKIVSRLCGHSCSGGVRQEAEPGEDHQILPDLGRLDVLYTCRPSWSRGDADRAVAERLLGPS